MIYSLYEHFLFATPTNAQSKLTAIHNLACYRSETPQHYSSDGRSLRDGLAGGTCHDRILL